MKRGSNPISKRSHVTSNMEFPLMLSYDNEMYILHIAIWHLNWRINQPIASSKLLPQELRI